MTGVTAATADVSPSVTAAVLLLARTLSKPLGLPCSQVAEILESTGAKHTQAYELMGRLSDSLSTLQRPPGRPASLPAEPPAPGATAAVAQAALAYVMAHPGCVHAGRTRTHYSDDFRHFIIELREQYATLALEHFAAAVNVPLGTIKDWLNTPALAMPPASTAPSESATPEPEQDSCLTPHIQTVLNAWQTWSGTAMGFCDHVQKDWRIPLGRTSIMTILEAHGVRVPRRRPGRTPDDKALEGTFRTFFPGAQWEGDGMSYTIVLDQSSFSFNVEPMVDSYSSATVGLSLRDTEDSQAVTDAFADGVATTGEAPLAVVLDNRGSNLTPEVEAALGETWLIRATPARGQNKPHVEGGFGLFSQTVPPVVISTRCTPRELARQIAVVVVATFFRIMNHRPRRDRGGRSRVDLYGEKPTPDEIEAARAKLKELQRKQLLAQQTADARLRPEVRTLLDDAFQRLGLEDPTGNQRKAIAYYPRDDILAGLAVFEGKQQTDSLPRKPGFEPGRYLLGIVRNIAQEREGLLIAEILLRQRLAHEDAWLAGIRGARDLILRAQSDPAALVSTFLDRALHASPGVDRLFWLTSTVDTVIAANGERDALLRLAARRINATHDVPYADRLAAFRFLAERAVPLA
jgi:hypothetical protein